MSKLTRPGRYPHFLNWPVSEELFLNPPDDFRPATYWFWSREVDPGLFRERLAEMKQSGIVSFWIQPRLGYPMEKYLSDEYFDHYRKALDIAKELEMYVGIYDDYNWITGHCGGRTVAGHNEFRESHIFWTEVPLAEGQVEKGVGLTNIRNMLTEGHREGMPWIYENGQYDFGEWQVLRAFTYQRGQEIDPETVKNVTSQVQVHKTAGNSCEFSVDGELSKEASHLLVFATARCTSSRMIDYLSPEAVARFLEVGYDPYYEELKDYWDMIWAMFIDEPYTSLFRWDEMEGDFGNAIMYNPDFLHEFKHTREYDICDHLYAVVRPAGDLTAKWRSDFFQAYAERVQKSFFQPIRNWCDRHGVRLVGHELMTQLNCTWSFTTDSGFDVVTNFGADYFGMGAYKDTSTTDSGCYRKNISPKLASSVAHVLGKNGSMLEQYTPGFDTDVPNAPGARGDWNITAQTVRRQMDYYALQGLSQFLWHGYFQSNDVTSENTALYSQRFDFPPGINFEPWFRYFRDMSNRNARLAYFLSLGTHVAPVAVLYPMRTYWSRGRADLFAKEGGFLHENLSRLHFDYDFIDERNILGAEIRDGKLIIGEESYSLLVLQAVSTLENLKVVKRLQEFAAQGGAIIFSGRLPDETQENGRNLHVAEVLQNMVAQYERVIYFQEPLSTVSDGRGRLQSALDSLDIRSISITEEGIEDVGSFYCLRQDGKGCYLALLNDEPKEKHLAIRLPKIQGAIERWDVENGERMPWPNCEQTQDGLVLYVTLEAYGATCFRIDTTVPVSPGVVVRQGKLVDTADLDGRIQYRLALDGNQSGVLEHVGDLELSCVRAWENGHEIALDIKHHQGKSVVTVPSRELPPPSCAALDWELTTEDGRRLTVNTQAGWEKQGLSNFSGGAIYSQRVTIAPSLAAEKVYLRVQDVHHTIEVRLNGKHCGTRVWAPYAVDISSAIQVGENVVELLVTNTAGNEMYDGTHYDIGGKASSGILGDVTFSPLRQITITIDC